MIKAALIYILISMSACVSVNLDPSSESKRATGVEVKEPSKPFVRMERTDVDGAWRNDKNGNVISYLSDCKDPGDPSLDAIVSGVVAGLAELNYDSKESVTILGREGRRVLASGKVDGVPSLIDLLVFKRNHCIYILTQVGVKTAFNADRGQFSRFINGFQVP